MEKGVSKGKGDNMRRLLTPILLMFILSCTNMEDATSAINYVQPSDQATVNDTNSTRSSLLNILTDNLDQSTDAALYLDNNDGEASSSAASLRTTYDSTKNEDGSVTITATLINESEVNIADVDTAIAILGDGELTNGQRNINFSSIAVGETRTADWTIIANSGSVRLYIITTVDSQVTTIRAGRVTSGYSGWVSGDMHTHSIHSDGVNTIFENFSAANKVGMDFVAITDHNSSRGWEDAQEAGLQNDISQYEAMNILAA